MSTFLDDFNYLQQLLRKEAPSQVREKATEANLRQMLLAARDVAPEDRRVLGILDEFALRPVTGSTPKVSRASRRVCLIERKDGSESTGVLIGPDLVLTAAHALRGSSRIFADPSQVTVKFDEFMWNDRTKAEGVTCALRINEVGDQPDIIGCSIRLDKSGRKIIFDSGLDYIIVRIDRMIGWSRLPHSSTRLRGWMDVHLAEIPPAAGPVRVLQHPLGQLLQLSEGKIHHVDDDQPSVETLASGRFRYRTNASVGTSGAPILNERNILVGMHVGESAEDGEEGISWQAIFSDLRGVSLEPNPAQAPLAELLQSNMLAADEIVRPYAPW